MGDNDQTLSDATLSVVQIKTTKELPKGWNGDCIPWGDDHGDLTCKQILGGKILARQQRGPILRRLLDAGDISQEERDILASNDSVYD
jgi:hypothetical protein